MRKMLDRLRPLLAHRHLGYFVALPAILLCAPSLRIGWVLDDFLHRAALTAPESLEVSARTPVDLFAFAGEGWSQHPDFFPWWVADDFKIAFFRPLTGWTHWLDYQLWPEEPMWMHLHSLFWLGLCVIAAGFLFRRLAPPAMTWVAGLALVLFAVDESHATAAVWIASRNALTSLFFTVLCLIAYDRWRQDGWKPGRVAAPMALLAAVLSAEAGVACGAYLLAYALCLDRGPLKQRLKPLIPCATTGVAWLAVRSALGYGVTGNRFYIDPIQDPGPFLGVLWERFPILLSNQLATPPADLYGFLAPSAAGLLWWAAVILIAGYGLLLWPLLKNEPTARFWALALPLTLVPICTTVPSQRLLALSSLAGAGLTAVLLAAAWTRTDFPKVWRLGARAASIPLILIHLILAPIGLLTFPGAMQQMGDMFGKAAESLPSGPEVSRQHLVLVNGPTFFMAAWAPIHHLLEGRSEAEYSLTLAPSIYEVEIERPDARTLVARTAAGFFPPSGTAPPDQEAAPFNMLYMFQNMDHVYYDGSAFEKGQTVRRGRIEIEITTLTEDLRPAEIRCHFPTELEDTAWRWMQWEGGRYVPWTPPPVGSSITLPAPTL